jgi:Protein of unknown function (DUF3616)
MALLRALLLLVVIRIVSSLLAALALALFLGEAARAAPDNPPAVAPQSGPLDSGMGFSFPSIKTRRALSGIACPVSKGREGLCLAVFDEGAEARHLTINGEAYVPDNEQVALRPGNIELDAEAAATDGAFYYVAGSHSAKRNDCANNPESRHVIRFRVDPKSGRALRNVRGTLVDYADTDRLWSIMATTAQLQAHVGDSMCLGTEPPRDAPQLTGRRGINIEGLAVKNGRLFFGFRGPVDDGRAHILAVNADGLFSGKDARPARVSVNVGKGRAIRDLLAVSDGVLVLSGPDDDEKNSSVGWVVSRWDGQETSDPEGQIKTLATLDLSNVKLRSCDHEPRPEALAITADKPGEAYQALIFSDGMCDGGALRFTIPR